MKTNKIIIMGLMASTIAMTGCKDSFLDVESPNGEALDEYFTTKEHIEEAVVACYDPLHWPDWGLGQYNALNIDAEIQGDDFWVGGTDINDNDHWHKLFNFEGTADKTLSSLWTVDYSGIKRCNDVLFYTSEYAKDLDPAFLKEANDQARILRVFYYNMLWHYFGNVPFYLENLTLSDNTAPQLPADEVYDKLIVELEDVLENIDLPMRWDDRNSGRVSKAMAYMLYAEMVMYQNDETRYAKALAYMKEIIDDQADYDLMANYSDIWTTSGEWCKESIWEINYNDAGNERGWNSPLAIGGTVLPTLIGPNGFHYLNQYGFDGDGWGFLVLKKETAALFEKDADGNYVDARGEATVWNLTGTKYTERYQDTHLWLGKYKPQNANNAGAGFDTNLNYNNNYRYYRFAETLLNAAELAVRTNADPSNYLQRVQNRANKPATAVTVDNIINERHLEFVGEGKRYWDLVRSGKAATVLVPDLYGYRTNRWTPNKKHIPIAQAELDSDPALKQNDQYFQ